MLRPFAVLLFCLLFLGTLAGQNEPFFLNGAAVQLNDSCFRLTPEAEFVVGSIWHPERVDLRKSFDLVTEMFFGCADELGADGIVFGLQPVSASIGTPGEGLGIGGVRPAVAVEFDTYYNDNRLDPVFDHVAIMANGAVTHAGPDNLAGPVRASASRDNIENCANIPLRVTWDAGTTTLRVYFDCDLRLEYTGDIVNEIFGGDPFVFYGFAAATGGLTNRQEICFTFNSFQKQLRDVTVCPGGKVILDVTGGVAYEWSPAAGLSSTTEPTVDASPDSTTVYTVRIFDDCGIPLLDTVRITVAGDSAFVRLGPDTTLCPGEGLTFDVTTPTAVYQWSDPTLSGPVVAVSAPGTYGVTATRTDIICTAADRITVAAYAVPDFDLGLADTTLCRGEVLEVVAVYPDAQAYLDDGTPFDTTYVGRSGVFRAYVEHPCVVQYDQITISVESCRAYYVASAFSPDGDGNNDRLFPQEGGDVLAIYRFSVYDRWGELVFDATDPEPNRPDEGWGGDFRGRPAAQGNYVWMMDAAFRDGSRRIERGTVVLLRP